MLVCFWLCVFSGCGIICLVFLLLYCWVLMLCCVMVYRVVCWGGGVWDCFYDGCVYFSGFWLCWCCCRMWSGCWLIWFFGDVMWWVDVCCWVWYGYVDVLFIWLLWIWLSCVLVFWLFWCFSEGDIVWVWVDVWLVNRGICWWCWVFLVSVFYWWGGYVCWNFSWWVWFVVLFLEGWCVWGGNRCWYWWWLLFGLFV